VKTDRDQTAFPLPAETTNLDCIGLTKREYFAIQIMQGFAACDDPGDSVESIARCVVIWADALIEELNK